jgi:flavin reductase (DIM6/NTAB) family NADH-FMN oxidoreductase RutF
VRRPAPDAVPAGLVALDPGPELWERVLHVAPLVLVGTREAGGYDLAPKHMAAPLGSEGWFLFVCTPRHATYWNAKEHGAFTVSFPTPELIVGTSLAASAREGEGRKPGVATLETFPATTVDGPLVAGCPLHLECELDRVVDGFGDASLVVGRIVAALADEGALLLDDADPADVVRGAPLLAYVSPGRFARVANTLSFPFPVDFSR